MSHRIDPTIDPEWISSAARMAEGRTISSTSSEHHSELLELPQLYGRPLFEFLIVDPQFVFVSWEISPEQDALAHKQLGPDRWVEVAFTDVSSGDILARRRLYGNAGRWFVYINLPGRWLSAELNYSSESSSVELFRTAAIFAPRDSILEPDSYEELTVQYDHAAGGRLSISGTQRTLPLWPDVSLQLDSSSTTHLLLAPAGSHNYGSSSENVSAFDRNIDALMRPNLPSLGDILPPQDKETADD